MASINEEKPIERITKDSLPDANQGDLTSSLKALVEHSSNHDDVAQNIHTHMHIVPYVPWIHKIIPGIEKLTTKYHVGNFVMVRGTNQKIFESMPIYAR